MSGFLLTMINRHQGRVDKVQPRIRSMFEPESAIAAVNAAANTTDKQSGDIGYEKQSRVPKSPAMERSIPENPLSASRLSRFQQAAAQFDQAQGNKEPSVLNRNLRGFTNKPMAYLKSELTPTFNQPQQAISPGFSQQSTHKAALNVTALNSQIEENLKRYKNQTSHLEEVTHDSQHHASLADSLAALPAQAKIKTEQSAESERKSANQQTEAFTKPISSQEGAFQVPNWLSGLQAEFNNRLMDMNAQSHAEPVINVTIGRIEVRAINPESVKPLETRQKPSGVLSLEDYLKQLENKRRT